MAIIRMRDHLYDEIVNYAKEHLPEEACGLLAGVETEEGREIQKVYFLENKDHAEDHFTLDPRDQMNAIKDMRANGLKQLGTGKIGDRSDSGSTGTGTGDSAASAASVTRDMHDQGKTGRDSGSEQRQYLRGLCQYCSDG